MTSSIGRMTNKYERDGMTRAALESLDRSPTYRVAAAIFDQNLEPLPEYATMRDACEVALAEFAVAPLVRPFGFFVYVLYRDGADVPVYVGQSENWPERVGRHCKDSTKTWNYFKLIRCESSEVMREVEAHLIRKYRPEHNKHFPVPNYPKLGRDLFGDEQGMAL